MRVLYKRRWIAIPAFLAGVRDHDVQLDAGDADLPGRRPAADREGRADRGALDQMFQSQDGWFNDDFYQTQYRILQSRSLAKRTIDAMKLWDAPRLGNGPEPKSRDQPDRPAVERVSTARSALAKRPFGSGEPAAGAAQPEAGASGAGENRGAVGADRSSSLAGSSIVPVRNTRLVEIRYTSTDPQFAAAAANRRWLRLHPAEHGVQVQTPRKRRATSSPSGSRNSARRSRPANARCRSSRSATARCRSPTAARPSRSSG